MTMNDKEIMDTLQNYYNVANCDYNVFGVFLYGSQNYGLSTEYSDIDAVAIVFPTPENIIFKEKDSYTEVTGGNGNFHYQDVRDFFNQLRKGNPNAIEILTTDYYIINPEYEYYWNSVRNNKNIIWQVNPNSTLKAFEGMYHSYMKKFDSDSKPKNFIGACRILMLADQFADFIQCGDEEPSFVLEALDGWELIGYKFGKLEILDSTVQFKKRVAKSLFNKCLANCEDSKAISILNSIQNNIMTQYLKEVIDNA